MAEFFPFALTSGQTVYLNPEHISSIRYNGGFYLVTTNELIVPNAAAGKASTSANKVYEVSALPFALE